MSHIQHIESKFEKIGARATIRQMTTDSFRRHGRPLVIDVLRTDAGEVFDIEKTKTTLQSVFAATNLPAPTPHRVPPLRPIAAQRRSIVPILCIG